MRKSQVNSFKLYSYRNVFNDGDDKLHPGFKIRRTLLVLTKTKPFHKRYIPLTGEELQSAHLKPTKCYLTTADNQQAKRYNNARAGELILPKENVAPLLPLLKISPFSTQLSMSDQTKTAPVATTPAAGKAALIHLLTMASGGNRALLVNPTVDAFPDSDTGEELPAWLGKINAQLTTPIAADDVFGHYSNFLVKGVDEPAKPFWAIIEGPCTIAHVRGVSDILTKELAESKTVNFNPTAFTEWFEKQTDQTQALAIVYQAAFGEGDDQAIAVMEIGSTLHVAADPADVAAALQTAVENAQPAAATAEGVVDATAIATEPVAETTAPDAAAIPATPVAEASVVEEVETTDGGTAIQSITNQGDLIRAAATATEAGAEVLEALANMNAAASQVASAGAKQLRATAAVLQAGGAPTASVELPANVPATEEVAA